MLEVGFDTDHFDLRIQFFEPFGNAHGRPAGTETRHHHGHFSVRLIPYFLSGAEIMSGNIIFIVKLIRPEIFIRILAQHFIGHFYGAVGAVAGRRKV